MMKWKFLALATALLFSPSAIAQTVSSGKVSTVAPSYTNGTAGALSLDTLGNLRVLAAASGTGDVNIAEIAGVATASTLPGALDVTCVSGCIAGSGVAQGTATAAAPTYVDATNNPLSLDLSGNMRVTNTTAIPAGTNNIGDVDVLSLPSIPAGTNNIGGVDVLSLPAIPAGSNLIGSVVSQYGAAITPADAIGNAAVAAGVLDSAAIAKRGIGVFGNSFNGTNWDRIRSDPNVTGAQLAIDMPTATAAAGIASAATSAVGSNLVLKASAGNLYSATITSGVTAGYGMLFNATSAPADGAVTPANCWVVPANSTIGVSYETPYAATTGITVVFSSTGCFTKTASATAFISGQVK